MKVEVEIPDKVARVVKKLIELGDYKSMDDFLSEASRSHLNTWYSKTWEKTKRE